jgi:hypothetical protein
MDGVSSATKPETARTADGPPPVLVLDNNVLRNEAVIDGCIARYRETGAQFALPEMVMFELTKHPDDWEVTVRRSLEYVLRCPEALVITHTAKDLGLAEEATGSPTERDTRDRDALAASKSSDRWHQPCRQTGREALRWRPPDSADELPLGHDERQARACLI